MSFDTGDLFLESIRHLAQNAVLLFAGGDPERQRVAEQVFVLVSDAIKPHAEMEQQPEQSNVHPLITAFRNLPPHLAMQLEGRTEQIYDLCMDCGSLEEIAAEVQTGLGKKGMSVSELVLKMENFLNGLQ